ncbi:MAG: Piwi domain-containing protein [Pseudomonadota bacterium]
MSAESKPYRLPGHVVLQEPKLRFGSKDIRDVDIHPMEGLLSFGPYSKDKLSAVSNPIRIGMIAPAGQTDRLAKQMRELEQVHQPRERKVYLPKFVGFEKTFGVRLTRGSSGTSIELPADLTERMSASHQPHVILAEALTHALFALRNLRHGYDVVVILLVDEWKAGYRGPVGDDFDLHDYVKAYAASEGICVQFLRDVSALDYFCRCSVAWRLGIALYTKAGGIPWVLADGDPGTAFIGIDYALRAGGEREARFAICCSQVFDAEGSGLEFVAYEADDVKMFGRNPFLRRDQMLKVMTRSLAIYQRKHSGDPPKRIVVHKNTEFRLEEVEGVFDAFPGAHNIELVHVQQSCGWRGIFIPSPQKPHGYPCHRGTTFQLGSNEALLWTQGNLPAVANGKDYFKEGKGTPEPLMLVRHAGLGSMDDLCRETLALTKMDWNNDGPYDRLPVTLSFAGTLATIVKRMPKLEPHSYPVRLFM